jgi:hypothetical protein
LSAFRLITKSLLLLFICLGIPHCAMAQISDFYFLHQNQILPDAKVAGNGASAMAINSDWTAAFLNPAALTLAKRIKFSCGFHNIAFKNSLMDGVQKTSKTEYSNSPLSHISIVYPVPVFRGALVWSFAYSKTADYASSYSLKSADEYPSSSFTDSGDESTFSFSLATQLSRYFSGGLALNLSNGKHTASFSQLVSEFGSIYEYSQDIKTSYNALKLSLGGLYQVNSNLQLGLQLVFPTVNKVEANDFDNANNYDYKTPPALSVGAGWQDYFWSVSASYSYQDLTSVSTNLPDYLEPPELQYLRNVSQFNLGAELDFLNSDFRLRTGLWLRSYPGHHILWAVDEAENIVSHNATSPNNTLGLSTGLGYLINEIFSINLSMYHEKTNLNFSNSPAGSFKRESVKSGFLLSAYYSL